jgi:fucose 4-O-acetylase-like acetyltransferase
LLIAVAVSYAIYAGVRLWQIGDAADYDSLAFFAYACLATLALFTLRPASAALAALGSGSYFIYLWHIFIVMALRDHGVFERLGPLVGFVVTFTLTASAVVLALLCIRRLAPDKMLRWIGA